MRDAKAGAVAVVERDRLEGIFTYQDLIDRVIVPKRDLDSVTLGEVMTRDVEWISIERSPGDALRIMVENDYTHIPVIDENGRLTGMLTLRALLEYQIHKLADELDSLMGYLSIDGSGTQLVVTPFSCCGTSTSR
jgi:signal-transduction protein with cAMP-binding, CBS, and nucleotidyltransferase domain